MRIDPLKATKFAVNIIVGAGTSTIVAKTISSNVSQDNIKEQITVPVASLAIGAMVSDITRKYTDAKIDEIVHLWNTQIKPKLS